MKKVLKKINHLDKLISETKSEIKVVSELPFYSIFKKMDLRESELKGLRTALREYYSQKEVLLENLELEIRKSKIRISSFQRELTLLKEAV